MALTDKNIVITPNIGSASADPSIVFTGASASTSASITLKAYPTNGGTLSIEGSAGQLFSIVNTMTGVIYSVNDISGLPSIQVTDAGLITLAGPGNGYVFVASNTPSTTTATGALVVTGGVGVGGNLNIGGTLTVTGGVTGTSSAATNAANVYQTADPASGTYRLLLGNATNANGPVYNKAVLYWNDTGSIIQGANISGTAAFLAGFTNSASTNPIAGPDTATQNGIGYVTSISLFGQSDGALYTQAFSNQWEHQIFGDYRTGQIAIRGKQANTWGAWRTVLDSTNYTNYAPAVATATPTTLGTVFGYTTSNGNTAVGCCAGNTTMTGQNNIAIGCCALITNTIGSYNVAIGVSTLCSNTSGINNVAIGYNSLQCNTIGTDNVAIGCNALRCNTSGLFNIALGQSALCLNTTGANNIAMGCNALAANTTGINNIGIGLCAGCAITSGYNNTVIGSLPAAAGCVCTVLIGAGTCERIRVDNSGLFINGLAYTSNTPATSTTLGSVYAVTSSTCFNAALGYNAGNMTMTGHDNIAIGCCALISTNAGCWNIAIGGQALATNNAGSLNVAIGYCSLYNNTIGTQNIALGLQALQLNTTGSANFAAGCWALLNNVSGSQNIAIGTYALCGNTTGVSNIGIGCLAGCAITSGYNNTVIGSLPAAAACVCTVLIGAGACERIRVDNSGLYINGTAFTSSIAPTSNVQVYSLGVGTPASGTIGTIRAVGTITANYSDDQLKTKLGNITNALGKVMSLDGFYYEPSTLAQSLGYELTREVGVSAQQVQAVLPEVVVPAPIDDKYLTIHYERLIPLLIEAIKELKAEVDELKGQK